MSGGVREQGMEFAVVDGGYDPEQVNCCLADLGRQLARLSAQTEQVEAAYGELGDARAEIRRLRAMLHGRPAVYQGSQRIQQMLTMAEEEAAEIVSQAYDELAEAQRAAIELRERVYEEAVQARRDFESALHARRCRERETDRILRMIDGFPEPVGEVRLVADEEDVYRAGETVPSGAPVRSAP
ncbi:ATPase [Polymorphospora rubra]|uniref:Uncharacterized protein n=1 Tax=Polymorphospora rubra TaxID=338584 RepID=A0A810NDG3_9ACTN|nr:ATPase [Polymorphospora rubra]BCJ69928.1 hypothetical protein Prubr_69490 [Polymorphospora rubra]